MKVTYGKQFRKAKKLVRWAYSGNARQLQEKKGKRWVYLGKVYALAVTGAWLVTKAVSLWIYLGHAPKY